jgi:hypothetical protein
LGSQNLGFENVGVVGVPRERVFFARPDLSCHPTVKACGLSAYFNIPRPANLMQPGPAAHLIARPEKAAQNAETVKKDLKALQKDRLPDLFPADQHIRRQRTGKIRIPSDGNADDIPARNAGFFDQLSMNLSHEGGLIQIDPAGVVSPSAVTAYEILPSWAGINQLLASGVLVPPSAPEFKAVYGAWDQEISKSYRSELDPEFHFRYPVDYLVTKSASLPAGLSNIYLVAPSVSAPEIKDRWSCVFLAGEGKARRSIELSDQRCDSKNGMPLIMAGMQPAMRNKDLSRERALILHLMRLEEISRASPEAKQKCRAVSISGDAYFVGISANETRSGAANIGRRRVDVRVTRPGKVALYLEYWPRPAHWHIAAGPRSEVVAILMGKASDQTEGLENPPAIQYTFSRERENACSLFIGTGQASYGGPAALAVNESLKVLAGRGLDRLYKQTNDGSWPAPTPDGQTPSVSFAVE